MITPSSLAAGNQVGVKNEQFAVSAQVIPQKNLLIGTIDPDKEASLTLNEKIRCFNAEQVGALTGFGFMLHRLAKALFAGGVSETWFIAQPETGNQATGNITFDGTATKAGTIAFYIAGERVTIDIAIGDDDEDAAAALAAEINATDELPVTAVAVAAACNLTSKSAGLNWGNYITLALNLQSDDVLPTGITAVITDMSGSTGTPDIQDALDSLGTGDAQNEYGFTNVIHGYGAVTAVLDALSTYNGIGNDFVGNYKKEVARPFRSLTGDTCAGLEYGLSDLLDFAEGRRETDRTNGIMAAPGEYWHPQELAARAMGMMAVTNSLRAQGSYIDKTLITSYAATADRWTNDYDNRDQAVKGGVGTTQAVNGVLKIQNLITFYRPAAVAPESNFWRSMRNISLVQNWLYNYRMNFERDKWKEIAIYEDTAEVTDTLSKEKARDLGDVIDDLLDLVDAFMGKGWLYNTSYTKSKLQEGGVVSLRAGLTGFDIISLPLIPPGEGGIINSEIICDTSIAILTAGGE
jgi:phage tail sheath gpL-like